VIYEVSSAGHRDPGVAGTDHACAGMQGENEHPQPGQNHWPAGQSRSIFDFQTLISNLDCIFSVSQSAFGPLWVDKSNNFIL
jgi:hypothetical protein